MASIIQGTPGTGSRDQLVGVTGDGIQAEIADVTFPVLAATNKLYVIDTTNSQLGSNLLVEKTKDLKDGTCRDDFVVTVGNKGTCFTDHAPELYTYPKCES